MKGRRRFLDGDLRHDRLGRALAARTRGLPLVQRLDPLWLSLVVGSLAAVAALTFVILGVSDRLGAFDQPALARARDDRLLANVQRGLDLDPLAAAAFDPAGNALYVVRRGGTMHRLDLSSGLWRDEVLPAAADDTGAFTAMRAACGNDPAADEAACADDEPVWALTDDDRLYRRVDGAWQRLAGGGRLTRADGRPVAGGDLTAAASSDDGRFLMVGAEGGVVGLFDARQRSWLALPDDLVEVAADQSIRHVRWWAGRFYIGLATGLVAVTPAGAAQEDGVAVASPVEGANGRILDLAVSSADPAGLLVLERGACADATPQCLRLFRLNAAGRIADMLIEETELFARFDPDGVVAAGLQGPDRVLVTAGGDGVHRYDPELRRWHRLDEARVFAAVDDGRGGLYTSHVGSVHHIADGERTELAWTGIGADPTRLGPTNSNVALTQLIRLADGSLVGRDTAGGVYHLTRDGAGDPISRALQLPGGGDFDPATVMRILVNGDRLALISRQDGLLVHDLKSREYDHASVSDLATARWLFDTRVPLFIDDRNLIGAVPVGAEVERRVIELDGIGQGAVSVRVLGRVNGRVRDYARFGDRFLVRIASVDQRGNVGINGLYDLTDTPQVAQVQPQVPAPNVLQQAAILREDRSVAPPAPWRDVFPFDGAGFGVLTDDAIHRFVLPR